MKVARSCLAGPLLLMVLTAGCVTTVRPSVHRHIEVGDSFDFTLEVKGRVSNLTEGMHEQRFAGFDHDRAGDILMELDQGPRKPEPYIHNVGFALAPDACAVDLGTETPLLTGARCNQPLPGDAWAVRVHNRIAVTCKVSRRKTQKITVPAGTFATTEIRCSSEPNSSGVRFEAAYWYSAEVGAMVKGVRREIDSTGKENWSIADQLLSFEAGKRK